MAKNEPSARNVGLITVFVVLVIAIFGSFFMYRTATTGNFVDPFNPKQYIFEPPQIKDSRLLYCPEGLYPEMIGKGLEAQINSGRKCIPSPYSDEYPYLKEYYCCAPVFSERYIEGLPRHPY